jgi:tRNA-dihydrouridine synthase B
MKLLLAPLQGFTDLSFRNAWQTHFEGIDDFYAPYITLQNDGLVKKSQWRDINPELNIKSPTPQILMGSVDEAIALTQSIVDLDYYSEVNLNLGCPYPMVTNRGRGSALLQHPDRIKEILDGLFNTFGESLKFSVKMRCGLESFDEMLPAIEAINQYPIAYTILHPRIAKQLFKGKADRESFKQLLAQVNHPLYYNGDILTLGDYQMLTAEFPDLAGVMLGRGVLQNPLLPQEIINGVEYPIEERITSFKSFHETLFSENEKVLVGEGHLLNKMKSYLPYFEHLNADNRKAYKLLKKSQSIKTYQIRMETFLRTVS